MIRNIARKVLGKVKEAVDYVDAKTQRGVGNRVPDVVFHTRVRDDSIGGDNPYRWEDRTTDSYFAGKRVVVFALPGAFTPTCTNEQLPTYEAEYDHIRTLGIDDVYCVSVNDAFVMNRWGKSLNIEKVKLIPDGNAEFTEAMGMLVKKKNLGFGYRSWRYAMVVKDGVIEHMFVEPGFMDDCPTDPYSISAPSSVISYLLRVR